MNGETWATAYGEAEFITRLRDAVRGDEFWIAGGTYRPTTGTDPDQSFVLKSGVKLYGGFAGPGAPDPNYRNLVTHETILTGNLGGGFNSYHVVVASGTDKDTLLDGFTVTGGKADGGGIENYGGGLYAEDGNAVIRYCTFRENSATAHGGGSYLEGGNVFLESSTFSKNTADGWGGGLLLETTDMTIANCTFTENSATDGGAIDFEDGNPVMMNCTLYNNTADTGGGLYNSGANAVLVNCTFSSNTASAEASGFYNDGGDFTIRNSIFWDAGDSEISGDSPNTGSISDSVVKGGFAGGTNIITTDPQLAALANNGGPTMTCALPEGSSAVDKGQPVGTTVSGSVTVPDTDQRGVTRPQGSGVDIGAFEREVSPTPGGGGGGCQSTTPAGAAWLMIPLALVLLRRKE